MTRESTVGKITDEGVAELRSRIGAYYTRWGQYGRTNSEVTNDSIAHFVRGMGERNPLYWDEEYARKTRYGKLIAPPNYVVRIAYVGGLRVGGLPGVHGFQSGYDIEFYKPIYVGDTIAAQYRPFDIRDRPSRFAKRLVLVYGETDFMNQKDELVAKGIGWTIRTERGTAREQGKYKEVTYPAYTPEELAAIGEAYEREEIRGSQPRYWEDVKIGDELTPVVKGPIRRADIALAGQASGQAHFYWLEPRRRHSSDLEADPETGYLEDTHRGHWEEYMARQIGVPGAYDIGVHRGAYLAQVATNWIGDDGFLKRIHGEWRLFFVEGDTTWFKGKVVRKYIEGRQHLVDLELWGQNQRGDISTPGRATVVLPAKSKDYFVPI